jgi:hypothetical protein
MLNLIFGIKNFAIKTYKAMKTITSQKLCESQYSGFSWGIPASAAIILLCPNIRAINVKIDNFIILSLKCK